MLRNVRTLEGATYILDFLVKHLEEVELAGGYLSVKLKMKDD